MRKTQKQATDVAVSAKKKNKKNLALKPASVALYVGSFIAIVGFVVLGSQSDEQTGVFASANNTVVAPTLAAANEEDAQKSVDKLVSTRLAADIAQTAKLPIASNVSNYTQSLAAESALKKTEDNIVAKPQIVQPNASTRSVRQYTTVAGDTVQKVADTYKLKVDTIKWANDLTSDALEAGKKLKIPPVDGIVYSIKDGDTVDTISEKYKVNKEQLITYNDLELGGLEKDKSIVLPNGVLPEKERPGYVAPRPARTSVVAGVNYGSYSGGSGRSNHLAASVGNRYAFGNCTWYAYERRAQLGRPIGSFWGNAATWGYYAGSVGFSVNRTPAPGAIMQNGGGYGHVAIVESINPGTSITITEMNGYRFGGGFNRIGRGTISWAEAVSGRYNYIH